MRAAAIGPKRNKIEQIQRRGSNKKHTNADQLDAGAIGVGECQFEK